MQVTFVDTTDLSTAKSWFEKWGLAMAAWFSLRISLRISLRALGDLRCRGRKSDHVKDETHPYRCSLRPCRNGFLKILETIDSDRRLDSIDANSWQTFQPGKPLEPTDAHHRPSKAGGLSVGVWICRDFMRFAAEWQHYTIYTAWVHVNHWHVMWVVTCCDEFQIVPVFSQFFQVLCSLNLYHLVPRHQHNVLLSVDSTMMPFLGKILAHHVQGTIQEQSDEN